MDYSPSHYDTWKLSTPEEHFGWSDEVCERCGGVWDADFGEDHCSMCLEEVRAEGKRGRVGK